MALVTHITLSKKKREQLAAFLRSELDWAIASRLGLLANVDRWERMYEAKPESKKKDFPFPDACNIVVPTIGIHTDALLSRVFRMIFQFQDVAMAKAFVPELEPYMRPLQKFINWSCRHEMDLENTILPVMISTFKLGNGFVVMPWVRQMDSYKTYGNNGKAIEINGEEGHNGPKPLAKRVQDIIVPAGSLDVQTAHWVSERSYLRYGELKAAERDGLLIKGSVKQIAPYVTSEADEAEQTREQLDQFVTIHREVYEIHRVQIRWDIDDDGVEENIVVIFEEKSLGADNFLGIYWHPYRHRRRDIVHFKLFPKDFRFYAAGMAEYLEQTQEEQTTIRRQRIDNATVANVRFWTAKRGSKITSVRQLWAGKVLPLDDPEKDLVGKSQGDVYPSSIQNEMMVKSSGEERTGVTQQSLGKPPRRETATVGMGIVQEANRRFDFNTHMFRMGMSELLMQAAELYQQYKPYNTFYVMGDKDGALVQQVLDFTPMGRLRRRMSFEVLSASQTINREIERQQTIMMSQMMEKFFLSMFQLIMVISRPDLPEGVKKYALAVAKSAESFMDSVLKDFDMYNTKDLLPKLEEFIGTMEGAQGGEPGGGSTERSPGGVETATGEQGMEQILGEFDRALSGAAGNGMGG